MNLKIFIFLFMLALPADSNAQVTMYDWVVGGTLKNLAKVYVNTANLPELKNKYIKKITNMRDDKFHKNYMKFYTAYKELPPDLKQHYIFTEQSTKINVIHTINVINKKELIAIINSVPSDFITKQTRNYMPQPQDMSPNQIRGEVMFLWSSLIQKI